MGGPIQMLAMMLLSQHLVRNPGPAAHCILWENDVMGIPESHWMRFGLMHHIHRFV